MKTIIFLALVAAGFSAQARGPQINVQIPNINIKIGGGNHDHGHPGYVPPQPQPTYRQQAFSCLVIDTGWNKTYLGQAQTALDAENLARQACDAQTFASNCQSQAKCSTGFENYNVRGYVCYVTDSGWNKSYRGDGQDAVEAEAHARQACQSQTFGSNCAFVQAQCEAY